MWVFFIYILTSLIFDLFLTSSTWATNHRFLIWDLFGIVEMAFLSYFFYLIINLRIIRLLIVILSCLYWVYALFHFELSNGQYNSTTNVIGTLIILIFSLSYFVKVMRPTAEAINIFTAEFFLVCALLLNVSSTLFLTIISNRLTANEMMKYWSINNYSLILTNIIVSIAFLVSYSQHKSTPPESRYVDFTNPYDR